VEAAPKGPFLSLNFSEKKGQKGEGRIDEKDAVGLTESHHEMLFSLDHAVPSIHSKIDDLGRQLIHKIRLTDKNF
jgi:hypothetical protein